MVCGCIIPIVIPGSACFPPRTVVSASYLVQIGLLKENSVHITIPKIRLSNHAI